MHLQDSRRGKAPLEDDQIVELYWARDERAIEETDLKYRRYLFTVAHNVLHDKPDCEECLNDTYLGAWNAIPPTRPRLFKAFLTAIARHLATKRYHKSKRERAVPSHMTVALSDLEDFLPSEVGVEEAFEARRLGQVLSDFLRALPERRRFIFMSRYYVADSIDVIAGDLGVSRSTVNKELAAIRDALRKTLEKEGFSL